MFLIPQLLVRSVDMKRLNFNYGLKKCRKLHEGQFIRWSSPHCLHFFKCLACEFIRSLNSVAVIATSEVVLSGKYTHLV